MLKVIDDVVYITRGDDGALDVIPYLDDDKTEPYELQEGDKIIFTVRETASESSPVVFSVESDSTRIVISHADTADATVGKYSADAQLVTANGDRKTFWPDIELTMSAKEFNYKNFLIMSEVTRE